jgi:protein CpxP
MKPLPARPFALLSLGLLLSLAPLRADDTPPPPPTPPAAPSSPVDGNLPVPPPQAHRMRRAYSLENLTEKLGLSADQQKKVGAILAGARTQMKALRSDESLSKEDKRAQMRTIASSTHDQIRATLTADQQAQFDALPAPGARAKGADGN